ncbi:MAG TPA: HAD-IIIA family hydrolase [Pseudomonadales bacterium]|nr:HAD-IIIA family hydrolase [Pseudomonadales bacterium]
MLLVFDWDGTLVDSTAKIVRCMQQAAAACHVEVLAPEDICQIIGLGLPEAIVALYPLLDHAQREAVRGQYVHFFIHVDNTPTPFFPSVEETLHGLRDDGYSLAVATGKSRRGLDRVLEQLGMQDFFHATRCADETCSKPDPQMLQELLAHFRCDAAAALMVGDTHFDMAMAQAIGMPRVAVSYGAHRIEQLLPYQPLACLQQFDELLRIPALDVCKQIVTGG